MMCPPPPNLRTRKGFSLIEAAIVLGVVGLVIGAIWVAAASIAQKQRVSQTLEGIFSIAEQLNRQFGRQPVASPCVTACGVTLTTTQMQAMISLPPGWSFRADGKLDSPIWKNIDIHIAHDQTFFSLNNFVLIFPNDIIPESDCKALGVELLKSLHRGNVTSADSYGDADGGGGYMTSLGNYEWWSFSDSGTGFPDPLIGAAEGCNYQIIYILRQ